MVALSEMEGEKKQIMVAIDETDASYHALIWVLDNLKETLLDTSLLIFAAVPEPNYYHYVPASFGSARLYATASPAPEVAISAQEHKKKVMLGLLDKAKSICTSHGVESETILKTGDAKLAICDAVENLEVSMLILGDEGRGRIQRALAGSVNDHCLQHAKCSVLVVKGP
uniref:UspA domain-containing protein n=1 Tax=Kalanchoe fedtschenkoi TaxID=63787 RepID=A0A7N0U1H3_KALFE